MANNSGAVATMAAMFTSIFDGPRPPRPRTMTPEERKVQRWLRRRGLRRYVVDVDCIVDGVPGRYRVKPGIMMGSAFLADDFRFVPIADEGNDDGQ